MRCHEEIFGGKEITREASRARITELVDDLSKLIDSVNEHTKLVEEIKGTDIDDFIKARISDMAKNSINNEIAELAHKIGGISSTVTSTSAAIYIMDLIDNINAINNTIENSSSSALIEKLDEIKDLRIALTASIMMHS